MGKVNADEANKTTMSYNVSSIPTLRVFEDGEAADRAIGAISKIEIEKMIKPYI